MNDKNTFKHLLPAAMEWAKAQEQFVLAHGLALSPKHRADAELAGVQDAERIRVLVVDRIPLPDTRELAHAARITGIMSEATRAMAIGYALIVRADSWGDRELLLHNLVHIAQCERSGGLENWVRQYLSDRCTCASFTIGSLEEEARGLARDICRADAAVA